MDISLLADLATDLPHAVRLQRLVQALRQSFDCGAVGLLKLEEGGLRPWAVEGLTRETLGRRFDVAQHPRLAAILQSRKPTRFPPGSPWPDPYDGLLDNHVGEPVPVHDCMGISLYVEGQLWGALTLDAIDGQAHFDDAAQMSLQGYALLVEAAVRVTQLEQESRSHRLALTPTPAVLRPSAAAEAMILGHSAVLQRLLHELDVVADSELPVLLLGETGVGKELFARRLHQQSRRQQQALVQVNCAALPEALAESELFGHVKGAFSGANTERAGRFEAAEGGTLLLDEVGELPLAIQAKLLRTLQNGEIQRLGADQPLRVNVRVLAATNRDLAAQVRAGHFRADLYHRLSVYPVPIPPLRERGHDVLEIAGHFLEQNRTRLGLRSLRLSQEAEQVLLQYPWPGNVRELEHVISRAAIRAVSRGAQRTDMVLLSPALLDLHGQDLAPAPEPARSEPSAAPQAWAAGTALPTLKTALATTQRQLLQAALTQTGQNWAEAARMLGVDASNLHKLARRLGLKA